MKYLILLLPLISISVFGIEHFWTGEVLSTNIIKKKWGSQKLDEEKFKQGDERLRATMAYDLVKEKKRFIGLHATEIRRRLGDPDGFYFSDINPAYIIQRAYTTSEEAWQIVFLLDKDRNVRNVIVHKQ